jgi:hypothetical protein
MTTTGAGTASITDAERRRIVRLLAGGSLIMVAYWAAWYGARSSVASNTRSAYYEFENAFPLADAWIVVCLLGAAWALTRRSELALAWLLLGAGAGVYLFGMDVLYDLEQGIWWKSGGGVLEAAINLITLAYSVGLARWAWSRRRELVA